MILVIILLACYHLGLLPRHPRASALPAIRLCSIALIHP
jgi:hypothetical protein